MKGSIAPIRRGRFYYALTWGLDPIFFYVSGRFLVSSISGAKDQ